MLLHTGGATTSSSRSTAAARTAQARLSLHTSFRETSSWRKRSCCTSGCGASAREFRSAPPTPRLLLALPPLLMAPRLLAAREESSLLRWTATCFDPLR